MGNAVKKEVPYPTQATLGSTCDGPTFIIKMLLKLKKAFLFVFVFVFLLYSYNIILSLMMCLSIINHFAVTSSILRFLIRHFQNNIYCSENLHGVFQRTALGSFMEKLFLLQVFRKFNQST